MGSGLRGIIPEVEIGNSRCVDVGDDGVDASNVDFRRVTKLAQDTDIDVSGRANRADQRRVLALEHSDESGDATLNGLFKHDVGVVETTLRTS